MTPKAVTLPLLAVCLLAGWPTIAPLFLAAGSPQGRGASSMAPSGFRQVQVRAADGQDCPSSPPTTLPSTGLRPADFVELVVGPGGGIPGPNYALRIRADGQLTWTTGVGSTNTTSISAIPAEEASALLERIQVAGFWNLCGRYSTGDIEAGRNRMVVRIGDQEKQVSFTAGGRGPGIQTLTNLRLEIDFAAKTFQRFPTHVSNLGRFEDFFDLTIPGPGITRLMMASAQGDIVEIERELKAGGDPNGQKQGAGPTALMFSSLATAPQGTKALLAAGANPNLRTESGQTALMAVAYRSSAEHLNLLIAAGADVNAQDDRGTTSLMWALPVDLRAEDLEWSATMIGLLRQAGARTDLQDSQGRTALDRLERFAARFNVKPSRFPQEQYDRVRQLLTR